MNELPPDAPRLRAILAYLDQQLADNEVVAIYLRLQRDDVRKAILSAEAKAERQQSRPAEARRARPLGRPRVQPGMYLLEPKRDPTDQEPAFVHTGDCGMVARNAGQVDAHNARLALTQDLVGAAPCPICRPDTALGLDLA